MPHILNIRRALAHVVVAEALIGLRNGLKRLLPRQGGIIVVFLNRPFGGFEKRGVFEHERLRAKNLSLVLAQGLSQRHLVPRQVGFGGLDGFSESFLLLSGVIDLMSRDRRVPRLSEEEWSNGNASRNRDRGSLGPTDGEGRRFRSGRATGRQFLAQARLDRGP
jgi:hypothetical protein